MASTLAAVVSLLTLHLGAPSLAAGSPRTPSDDPPSCAAPGSPVEVFPVGSRPYNRSYAEWSTAWWQWAFSVPASNNPILDATGGDCMIGQDGPVWFLPGTFGGSAVRDCSVPCDRALFLAILNCEWENGWIGSPVLSVPELRAICAAYMEGVELTLEVDGVPVPVDLQRQRVQSGVFAYNLPPDNIAGQPAGVYAPVVSDGYWVMIKPLPPGPHTLRFAGSSPAPFSLDVTYNLDVVDVSAACVGAGCP